MMTVDQAIWYRESLARAWRLRQLEWYEMVGDDTPHEEKRRLLEQIGHGLENELQAATCFLWDEQKWATAVGGAGIFTDCRLLEEDLLLPWRSKHLWLFDPPLYFRLGTEEFGPVRGVLLVQSVPALSRPDIWRDDPQPPDALGALALLDGVPGAADGTKDLGVVALYPMQPGLAIHPGELWDSLLSALHFLRNEIVGTERQQLSRSQRRRALRTCDHEPDIRKVIFRRLRRQETESDGSRLTVQFLVGWPHGFWRRQWYPSIQERRPLWIAPFVKGPRGAPFKGPREAVGLVAR